MLFEFMTFHGKASDIIKVPFHLFATLLCFVNLDPIIAGLEFLIKVLAIIVSISMAWFKYLEMYPSEKQKGGFFRTIIHAFKKRRKP